METNTSTNRTALTQVPDAQREPLSQELDARICREAIEAGCAAPSADNNQPWKIQVDNSRFVIFCDLSRRLPSDTDGMFDLLSIGAAIENINLQLSALGLASNVTIRIKPPKGHLQEVAWIEVSNKERSTSYTDLADSIFTRRTTRLPYSPAIELQQLEEITESVAGGDEVQISWESNRKRIGRFAKLVAKSDSLRFRYQNFHEELHRQLRLSDAESNTTRDGLDYRTLGLPPGGRWLLQLLRPWKRMEMLNRFGLATLMSLPTIRLVRASGAVGFISVPDRSPQAMVCGGRVMQRLWLKATSMGLSIHPLGSLPIFLSHPSLPDEIRSVAEKIRHQAKYLLPHHEGHMQMAFRIGRCNSDPGLKSLRRPLEDVSL
jgi:hypothetical protein